MSADSSQRSWRQGLKDLVLAATTAVLLTLLFNVLTFLSLHVAVPRLNEGARKTIALPWAPYALFAHVVPPIFTYLISMLRWRSRRHRIFVACVAAVTELLWFQYSGAHLLRRDWIGKF